MRKKASSESRSTAYACRALPEGYDLYKRIDLTKDRNSLVAINIWNLAASIGDDIADAVCASDRICFLYGDRQGYILLRRLYRGYGSLRLSS